MAAILCGIFTRINYRIKYVILISNSCRNVGFNTNNKKQQQQKTLRATKCIFQENGRVSSCFLLLIRKWSKESTHFLLLLFTFRANVSGEGTPVCMTCDFPSSCRYISASFSETGQYYIERCGGPGIPQYRLKSTDGVLGKYLVSTI